MPKFFIPATIPQIRVVKATDESRTSSPVMANDTDLLAALSASSTYDFLIRVLVQGATGNSVIQLGLFGPSSFTAKWTLLGPDAASTSQPASLYTRVLEESSTTTTYCTSANDSWNEIKGTVQSSSTAGNFGLRWCQDTTSTNATKVLAKSMLVLLKVA